MRISQPVDAARYALWVFLRMDAHPGALDYWLAKPYRDATRFGAETRAAPRASEDVRDILEAQKATVQFLEAAAVGADALTALLPATVHVGHVRDHFDGRGFIALDAPGTPLFEKAVALAMADYLTRPESFLAYRYLAPTPSARRVSSTWVLSLDDEAPRRRDSAPQVNSVSAVPRPC